MTMPSNALPDWLAYRVRTTPERLAVVAHEVCWTFADLDERASRMARRLATLGVRPGDRVAALLRNGPVVAEIIHAVSRLAAVLVPLNIRLTPEETWLRDEVARIRRLVPAPAEFAVISVPGLEERVDEAMRRAILQHEIGHGHFFTNERFAEHATRVWRETFTEQERAAFRAFLAREGYDPAIEEVMINEAMAYLIFTPDPRFFSPAHAGLTDARADALRAALREGAPR